MRRAIALALALLMAAQAAQARGYPCRGGLFFRPSLGKCFPVKSRMAMEWYHVRHWKEVMRLVSRSPRRPDQAKAPGAPAVTGGALPIVRIGSFPMPLPTLDAEWNGPPMEGLERKAAIRRMEK